MLSRKTFILILIAWIVIGVVFATLSFILTEPISAHFSTATGCALLIIFSTCQIQYAYQPVKYGKNPKKRNYLSRGIPHIYRGIFIVVLALSVIGVWHNLIKVLLVLINS